MVKYMKAAVMRGIGEIVVEERPIPKPKDTEVLVKIKHVGICGSDLHYYEHGRIGDFVVEHPIVLGHESSGEVVETGANVTEFQAGDRVTLEPGYTCGKCEFCITGRYNLCPDVVFMATPPYDGAFAEYVVHPAGRTFMLPKAMNTIEGALIEPLAVGFHAVKQGNAKVGNTALIMGSGCIGLVTLMALRASGVTEIYVTDMLKNRLDRARDLGAAEVFIASETDVTQEIMNATGGKGVDLVFETAGNKTSTQQTVDVVKRGGTIVLVGMAPDSAIPYNFGKLLAKEAEIRTVFRYRHLYPTSLKAVSAGLIPLNKIVTHTFKFADIAEAMKFSIEQRQSVVKAIVEF